MTYGFFFSKLTFEEDQPKYRALIRVLHHYGLEPELKEDEFCNYILLMTPIHQEAANLFNYYASQLIQK